MSLDVLTWQLLDYTRGLRGKFPVVSTMTIQVCNSGKLGAHEVHVDPGKYTLHTITVQAFIYSISRNFGIWKLEYVVTKHQFSLRWRANVDDRLRSSRTPYSCFRWTHFTARRDENKSPSDENI